MTDPLARTPSGAPPSVGIGVVGLGWMGAVHSAAYCRVGQHFPDLALAPRLVVAADPEVDRGADAVRRYGFEEQQTDWRRVVDDPRVAAVSITAPNHLHREIAVAAAAAGKHLWIEKPVGLGLDDARAVAEAVRVAGVQSAVGFNYRYAPAVERARRLLLAGAVGDVTHASVRLLSDYAAHPQGGLSWRFESARGGSGVLGDLASHGVDMVHHLLGEVEAVVADTAVFIAGRPRLSGVQSHLARASADDTDDLGVVENDDFVSALLRLRSGARVIVEASRVSVGEQCTYGFEIHGTRGALAWDFRRMGELRVCVGDDYQDLGWTTLFAGRADGDLSAFQPGAGIPMGYDDLKVIEAAYFLMSVADGAPRGADVSAAVRSAAVLDAMLESARTASWVEVAS